MSTANIINPSIPPPKLTILYKPPIPPPKLVIVSHNKKNNKKINKKITLTDFLRRSREIHKDKYDYSKITEEHIKNIRSEVPIKCFKCGNEWEFAIANHILVNKTGCKMCNKSIKKTRKKWTYERFMDEAPKIHNNIYDYSLITPKHVVTSDSEVDIICKICSHKWGCSINHHIYGKSGCPSCKQVLNWTVENFIKRATEIHKNKYDYSMVKSINNSDSIVEVKCNTCDHIWNVSVNNHIGHKSNCPDCTGRIPWTLELFINKAKKRHGEKFNYNEIKKEDIRDNKSKVTIICNDCQYKWPISVDNHINNTEISKCLDCDTNRAPWTLKKFSQKTNEMYGKKYTYLIDTVDINVNTTITIKCNDCNSFFQRTINSHINMNSGCSGCIKSKGEERCNHILNELNIIPISQFSFDDNLKYKYDFYFTHNNVNYILEYDGGQHFKLVDFFHDTEETFEKSRDRDIYKTCLALERNIKFIRIDYTQFNHIKEHIINAFNSSDKLYLSRKDMYQWLTDRI